MTSLQQLTKTCPEKSKAVCLTSVDSTIFWKVVLELIPFNIYTAIIPTTVPSTVPTTVPTTIPTTGSTTVPTTVLSTTGGGKYYISWKYDLNSWLKRTCLWFDWRTEPLSCKEKVACSTLLFLRGFRHHYGVPTAWCPGLRVFYPLTRYVAKAIPGS